MELRLANVTKRYGAGVAVDGIDLTFASGRTTALLGPSGCGKSTVLRLLLALVMPDAGEVSVDGRPHPAHDIEALRRRIGYVIQDGGLFPHLTAAGNVTLMARYLRWDAARAAKRLQELAALTRFPADALDRYPNELSGGQAQRVAIMRALLLDPEVLLLDEPLSALDPLVRAELRDDLRGIFRSLAKTVIVVTHDVSEAAHLADVVVLMRAGRVVQQGPFATIAAAPADPFVTAFLATGNGTPFGPARETRG
jgi:osmoprotectant transport system ATP-binding protein